MPEETLDLSGSGVSVDGGGCRCRIRQCLAVMLGKVQEMWDTNLGEFQESNIGTVANQL